jgi:hypothetical protein
MGDRRNSFVFAAAAVALSAFLAGCGTSLNGRVVKPDGSPLNDGEIVVYTTPRSESVRVDKDGSFSISDNIVPENSYTLIAEDKDGNMGYVRGFKPKKGSNKNIVVRMSREIEGKDAVMEGTGPTEGGNGLGEKILKSSQ